jgi:hypothetical protein
VDFLTWSITDPEFKAKVQNLPSFSENHKHDINHVDECSLEPEDEIKTYMLQLKNLMKLLRTTIVTLNMADKVSVMEKGFSLKKRKQGKSHRSKKKKTSDPTENAGRESHDTAMLNDNNQEQCEKLAQTSPNASNLFKEGYKHHILKRKRFHNFTEKVMAHEYLAYRRLDRLYHRATLILPSQRHEGMSSVNADSCYIVLSISGDMFLTGQVFRLIGVFIALANALVDPEFVDCVFDEDYPHLIPTIPAPPVGMVAAEAHYVNQEGKSQCILSPRVSDRYNKGWNQTSTLLRVKDWQEIVYDHIAGNWERNGRDVLNGRLRDEQDWTENKLKPWADAARQQLEEYRVWRKIRLQHADDSNVDSAPATKSVNVDPSVPEAFQTVLHHLREVDRSGRWPTTTPKRQLVMMSTAECADGTEQKPDSLSIAFSKAKNNKQERSSAYAFAEGQGGASGSFSVGFMPGGVNKQPKANAMFPELVKAAFELEMKLCPSREPSSTIAINRNAQFRPHTDSGAGAGQSTSLIAGLGMYEGGALVVEGEKHDIRYKAIEFNGWTQRHWTMPFKGERYSLVWFTPKGCEGMRGIDLDYGAN